MARPQIRRRDQMKVAIITGASSGLGWAYAEELDRRGEADEIWAVARRDDRLEQLGRKLKTPVRVIKLDLADRSATGRISELLCREKPQVTALVNAAGFCKFGRWDDLTPDETDGMLDVNVRALVHLTVAVLPYMTRRSRLLEIASSAAFQPLPDMNIYAATKAFVLNYTRALRWELWGRGVRVTAVCPGWARTEFFDVAKNTKNGEAVSHGFLSVSPRTVARWSLAVNSLHLPVATCGVHTLIQRIGTKIVPAWFTMGCWKLLH